MRNILVILSFLIFAGINVNAQTPVEDNPNAPEITFDKVIHDYGKIIQGGNGKCEFTFKNTGKEPLILSKPRSSCGCTVPTWPRQPILPGKTETIEVTYNTNKIGPINKTVTIFSNAKTKSVILRIKGKVDKRPAEVMPVKQTGASPVNK